MDEGKGIGKSNGTVTREAAYIGVKDLCRETTHPKETHPMTINIKVLGPGCSNCERVEANAKAAVAQTGTDATIEKVTDYAVFARYGLLFTPGLVINEKLVAGGRIPSVADISGWLAQAMA